MTNAAIMLIKYLFFGVSLYLIIFVFTFIVVVFNELFKENMERKGKKS